MDISTIILIIIIVIIAINFMIGLIKKSSNRKIKNHRRINFILLIPIILISIIDNIKPELIFISISMIIISYIVLFILNYRESKKITG